MATGQSADISSTSSVAQLLRDKDWSATPVGWPNTWPAALTAAVKFISASGFPMAVRWGPEFVLIYNDGYREILKDKHPWAMGRPFKEVWPEVQPQLGHLHEAILAGNTGSTFQEDLLLRIKRHGEQLEDARFTISYSPVPDEHSPSGVGGVLITAVETTARVKIEEALRASEERFARIFEQTSVGIIECALDGRFLTVNKRFCEITGRAPGELLQMRMPDLLDGEHREDHLRRVSRLIEDGVPYTAERQMLRPDGSIVWVSNNAAMMRDAEGKPLHLICVIQENTERVLAEKALRAGEERLNLALSAGKGIGTWDWDVPNDRVYADDRFARLYGVDPQKAKSGAPVAEFLKTMHSDDLGRVQAEISAALSTGGDFNVEYRLLLSDGSVRWVVAQGRCTFDEEGKPSRFPGVSFDITDRKIAEERLQQLNLELERKVIERTQARGRTWQVSPDLMGALNSRGYFETSNPAWNSVLGWSEAEVASMSIFELLHPDDVERTKVGFQLTQEGQPAIKFPNRYRSKDGSYRWISWIGVPEDGMVYCTGRDITADKALEDSEGQFRTLAQAMPNHVWTAPETGSLDWFNDRVYEYSGAASGALDGTGWTSIVHPDDLPGASARWSNAITTGKVYETEFRLRRADGSYRWHLTRAAPVKDEVGHIVRWVGTNTDIEEERQTRIRLSEAQNELNTLLNSAASAFYSVGTDGATTSCNTEFLRILGFEDLSQVIGHKLHDVIHHTHPDGRHYPKSECPIYLCAQHGTKAHVPEELFFRKDGTPVPVEYWVRPLFRDGVLVGAICNFNDISARKYADEQRALLLNELNHRVKNLFALVGGIVSLSARNAATPKELAAVLQGRLGALSRAHELIHPGLRPHDAASPGGVDLADLIAQILAPYASPHLDERIKVEGPKTALSGEAVTGMALIFHELATNAAKYGALCGADGKLTVNWDSADGVLQLHWLETGCPPRAAEAPQHQGFGSVLLRRSIEGQFGGTIVYSWNSDGLAINISALLSRLS
jgi:PAS domain S-box-containing protein